MKHPVRSMVAELRRTAEAAREALAAELYSPEKLRVAMMAAAAQGFEHATIRGPDGLDLSGTKAADEATMWLASARVSWDFQPRGGGGIEAATAYDLVLSWKPAVGRQHDEGGGAARAGGGSTAPGGN